MLFIDRAIGKADRHHYGEVGLPARVVVGEERFEAVYRGGTDIYL